MFTKELQVLWEEILALPEIVLRSFFSVVVLFALTRLMGKKQISQLTFFDYCVGISIGSIAAQMAGDDEASYIDAIIAMAVYASVSLLISYGTQKSLKARQMITGTPVILMEKGRILFDNLKKSRFDLSEFLEECRYLGYFDLNDIEYAVLEPSGKISILQRANKKPASVEDLRLTTAPVGLSVNLVLDGAVIPENLKARQKDESWLMAELKRRNIGSLSDVLLATCGPDDLLTVYKKGEQPIKNIKM